MLQYLIHIDVTMNFVWKMKVNNNNDKEGFAEKWSNWNGCDRDNRMTKGDRETV